MSRAVNILVTGAEGYVGSVVVAHLREHGHDVTTLTLPAAVPHVGVRVVRGDACDPAAVAAAVEGVDAVAHLAAIPNPWNDPAHEVFGNNTLATFSVLWTAAERGVRRLVTAGSVNAAGLLMNPYQHLPAYYPVDEAVPPDVADPYSLSKQVDELTLRAVCRRFGASGVALRLPLMVSPSNVDALRAWSATRLAESAGDYTGAHVVHLAAADTFTELPTEELLSTYAPAVPRRGAYPGRTAPVDTGRARDLLGFAPRYGGS